MKTLSFLLFSMVICLSLNATSTPSSLHIVLCTSKGMKLTNDHFDMVQNFAETNLVRFLTSDEVAKLKNELTKSFIKNPEMTLSNIMEITKKSEIVFLYSSAEEKTQCLRKLYDDYSDFWRQFSISKDIADTIIKSHSIKNWVNK